MLELYNERVLSTVCPTCGAGLRQRCKPKSGASTAMRPVKPHKKRLEAANG